MKTLIIIALIAIIIYLFYNCPELIPGAIDDGKKIIGPGSKDVLQDHIYLGPPVPVGSHSPGYQN